MATLLYQGHGSYRITLESGRIIYIDPYAGEGYDKPADLILITHEHGDHNCIDLMPHSEDCVIIRSADALRGGNHNKFEHFGVTIQSVLAENKNHDPKECVGYVLQPDGVKLYAAGDTSETSDMHRLKAEQLDYAILPCDGIYNMDIAEASKCAEIISARHSIPVHIKPGELFDRQLAETFTGPGRIILEPGEELTL